MVDLIKPNDYVFFWAGPFSNFYSANYTYKYINKATEKRLIFKFTCSEQGYMWEKAVTFDDLDTAKKILNCNGPKQAKALGRLVKNFDQETWDQRKEDVMYKHCFEKFTQNEDLKKMILDTENRTLVEASPYDKVWGIGLFSTKAKQIPKEQWPGLNLLGKTLMKVRTIIKTNNK